MKKFFTVAAITAVLGAGVLAEPAHAGDYIQRYNALVELQPDRSKPQQEVSKLVCDINEKALAILHEADRAGYWIDGKSEHQRLVADHRANREICRANGHQLAKQKTCTGGGKSSFYANGGVMPNPRTGCYRQPAEAQYYGVRMPGGRVYDVKSGKTYYVGK